MTCFHLKGVETENTASFSNAIKNGGPIYTPCSRTLADGLAVPTVGYNAYATVKPLLDKMVVVEEKWIPPTILHLVELEKSIVEGAGTLSQTVMFSKSLTGLGYLDIFYNYKFAFCRSIWPCSYFGGTIMRIQK